MPNGCGNREECKNPPSLECHTCPYSVEVDGDEDTLCNCCEDCEEACAQSI